MQKIIDNIRALPQIVKIAAVYGILTLGILAPLLLPGYIFATDMVFTPSITLPEFTQSTLPLWAVLWVLSKVMSVGVIQKIILLTIIFGSGFGMHLWMTRLKPASIPNSIWIYGAYFAGILYAVNPFVYSRFMAGQWAILLGYALLPIVALMFMKLCEKPNLQSSLRLALVVFALCIVSLHAIVPAAIICGVLLLQIIWERRHNQKYLKSLLCWAGLAIVITLLFNGFWILPLLLGDGQTAATIGEFGSSDQQAFATDSSQLGALGNLLTMHGFWADSKNLYLLARDIVSWWLWPIVGIWVLVCGGIVIACRKAQSNMVAMLVIFAFGVILALGTASGLLAPFNEWLYNSVPFFAGYREPQKFACLIVIAYAYFGAMATAYSYKWLSRQPRFKEYSFAAMTVVFCLPLLSAPLMFWGFHGQLAVADYPVEWYAINDRLDAECTGDCVTLFLPWHLYMNYSFANRVIANPAPKFFGSYILSSNDPELEGATAYSTTEAQKTVQQTILPKLAAADSTVIDDLRASKIKFVLLAKEFDYERYNYLSSLPGLQVSIETPTLILYEVTP